MAKKKDFEHLITLNDYIDTLQININQKRVLKMQYKTNLTKTFSDWANYIKL